jgi:hypothetical protein
MIKGAFAAGVDGDSGIAAENTRSRHRSKIDDLISDGHPPAKCRTGSARTKYGKRQILNGKIAIGSIGGTDPTPTLRVIGGIDLGAVGQQAAHSVIFRGLKEMAD